MSQKALPPRSVWQRLNPVLPAVGFPLLGQACFSEWSLLAFFPGCPSISPIFCPFCSPSRCFCHLSPTGQPVLHGFCSSDQELALQQPHCAIRGHCKRRKNKGLFGTSSCIPRMRGSKPRQKMTRTLHLNSYFTLLIEAGCIVLRSCFASSKAGL